MPDATLYSPERFLGTLLLLPLVLMFSIGALYAFQEGKPVRRTRLWSLLMACAAFGTACRLLELTAPWPWAVGWLSAAVAFLLCLSAVLALLYLQEDSGNSMPAPRWVAFHLAVALAAAWGLNALPGRIQDGLSLAGALILAGMLMLRVIRSDPALYPLSIAPGLQETDALILMTEPEGRIVYVNRPQDLWRSSDGPIPETLDALQRCLEDKGCTQQLKLLIPDETLQTRPLSLENGQSWMVAHRTLNSFKYRQRLHVWTFFDLTEEHRILRQLEERREELTRLGQELMDTAEASAALAAETELNRIKERLNQLINTRLHTACGILEGIAASDPAQDLNTRAPESLEQIQAVTETLRDLIGEIRQSIYTYSGKDGVPSDPNRNR